MKVSLLWAVKLLSLYLKKINNLYYYLNLNVKSGKRNYKKRTIISHDIYHNICILA